jgi:hypothetical protein
MNPRNTSMTILQSFPPEICSLICLDPILDRLDLNSICFISHAFRNEAQRQLSSRFPCLRGASQVRAWCLSLQCSPHLAINIKGLVLLLPRPLVFPVEDIVRITRTLNMCVNLKELAVLLQGCHRRRPGLQEKYSPYMLWYFSFQFTLTKFVNGYFSQEDNRDFAAFLRFQPKLEILELHSGKTDISQGQFSLHDLKTLGCPPQFLDQSYSIPRLRLDFEISKYPKDNEIDVLGHVLNRNLTRDMKSLAIFLKQKQSHFPEIIRVIATSHIHIQHLEIHQFLPTRVRSQLPSN